MNEKELFKLIHSSFLLIEICTSVIQTWNMATKNYTINFIIIKLLL